jgi:hypothetical protein
MAAPTSISPIKAVKGKISVAQVAFTGAETKALVAAVTGKKIHVLGLHWSGAAAATIILSTATDAILTVLNAVELVLPLNPMGKVGQQNQFVKYLETNVSEALNATSAQNSRATVWFVQE